MCTAAVRPCVKCRCGRAPLPLIQVWRVLVNPLPPSQENYVNHRPIIAGAG